MTGSNPETVATPEVKRIRASGPILILAVLFVAGAFLSWYFSWFGRDLSDADLSQYLVDDKRPRRVQHALLQIQQRLERGDPSAKQWYPQITRLATHPETEFRLTAAWLMGFDGKSEEFHATLLQLVRDPEPIVRRNAALALVRFADPGGRDELVAMLSPYIVSAKQEGQVASTLKEGALLTRGTLVARITLPDQKIVEIRSPLPGKLERIIAPSGSKVTSGAPVVTINSDEDSLWEAMRGLALIGETRDVTAIEPYANGSVVSSDRTRQQADLAIKAIRSRAKQQQGSYLVIPGPGQIPSTNFERTRNLVSADSCYFVDRVCVDRTHKQLEEPAELSKSTRPTRKALSASLDT